MECQVIPEVTSGEHRKQLSSSTTLLSFDRALNTGDHKKVKVGGKEVCHSETKYCDH